MFKKLFGHKERKTGTYKIIRDSMIEYDVLPEGGSINSICLDLGYHPDQIHTVITFDSKIISDIGVKIFTKMPVFVITEDKVKEIDLKMVHSELNKIDWGFEYSSFNIEDILEEGIDNETLTYDYLNSVLSLSSKGDKIFLAKELDLYLKFENNILSSFESTDGLSAASKWLKSVNYNMFENMLQEAQTYHDSNEDAIEELNCQCSALRSIPESINNEFIEYHLNPFGNYNFYNLYAAHYASESEITKSEFLLVNKGRVLEITNDKFIVGGYSYLFDDDEILANVMTE